LLAFGVVVVYVFTSGGRLADGGGGLATAGLVLLVGGLIVRWPFTIPWAILFAGGGYLLAREGNAAVDGWAAAIGVLLLLAAELASWSMEHDARIKTEPALVMRRAATLGGKPGDLFGNAGGNDHDAFAVTDADVARKYRNAAASDRYVEIDRVMLD